MPEVEVKNLKDEATLEICHHLYCAPSTVHQPNNLAVRSGTNPATVQNFQGSEGKFFIKITLFQSITRKISVKSCIFGWIKKRENSDPPQILQRFPAAPESTLSDPKLWSRCRIMPGFIAISRNKRCRNYLNLRIIHKCASVLLCSPLFQPTKTYCLTKIEKWFLLVAAEGHQVHWWNDTN